MKVEIELPDEAVDEIVRKELKWALNSNRCTAFTLPSDLEHQEKLVPALELVCKYFGVSDDL